MVQALLLEVSSDAETILEAWVVILLHSLAPGSKVATGGIKHSGNRSARGSWLGAISIFFVIVLSVFGSHS